MGRSVGRYVVITPARDEGAHLGRLVAAMRAQCLRPAEWVIVDDGSADETGEIAAAAAGVDAWITAVARPDRGRRVAGRGVMEAFAAGTAQLRTTEWDHLVKLDADIEIDPDYFRRCVAEFERDPALGIGGGVVHNPRADGTLARERHPAFHVSGAVKMYRRRCWDDIAPVPCDAGWDTYDEVAANHAGWRTRSFPDLRVVQHRFTGDAAGQWRNWVKNGRAARLAGYDPVFLVARCVARLGREHPVRSATGLAWGYAATAARREPLVVGPELLRYVRRQQRNRLVGRATIWR